MGEVLPGDWEKTVAVEKKSQIVCLSAWAVNTHVIMGLVFPSSTSHDTSTKSNEYISQTLETHLVARVIPKERAPGPGYYDQAGKTTNR